MFKLAVVPYFWAPVTHRLIGDMDAYIDVDFKAKFKRLEQEEYESLMRRMGLLPPLPKVEGEPELPALKDRDVLDLVLLDWDGIVDANDVALPYTRDNLAQLEKVLGLRAAIVKGFFAAHNKAAEKNFAPQPATTTAG